MSRIKLERMIQKNLMMENRYLSKKNILLEYDEKVVESKKNEIVSTLQSLKAAQKGMLAAVKKSEIDKQIAEVQSISTKNVCNGKNLNQEISSKLTDAENTLKQYDSQLDDCPEGCKNKLKENITFIKEFCTKEESQSKPTQDQYNKEKENPAPSGDQYYKSQQDNNKTQPQGNLIRATSNQTQNTQQPEQNKSSNIPDSERKPRFMDELDRLNTDQRFTKQDIIDYVKSRVKVKTT